MILNYKIYKNLNEFERESSKVLGIKQTQKVNLRRWGVGGRRLVVFPKQLGRPHSESAGKALQQHLNPLNKGKRTLQNLQAVWIYWKCSGFSYSSFARKTEN